MTNFIPSTYQQNVFDWLLENYNNGKRSALVIEALAGTGKTTTLIELLKLVPHSSCLLVAFNKSIQLELKAKTSYNCNVFTYHALGFRALRNAFGRVQVDGNKYTDYLKNRLPKSKHGMVYYATKLASILKSSISNPTNARLNLIVEHFGLDMPDDESLHVPIFDLVRDIMEYTEACTSIIDFNDMCYLPVKLKLPMQKYDVVFVDEAQDTSGVQLDLCKNSLKPNGTIIFVGDQNQAIYGFRGAGINSMDVLKNDFEADVLPLNLCYRCGDAIIEHVNRTHPRIPIESTGSHSGHVGYDTEELVLNKLKSKDLVICRNNAPLVRPCLRLISQGKKAVIIGKDIGKGLQSLFDSAIKFKKLTKTSDFESMLDALDDYVRYKKSKLYLNDRVAEAAHLHDRKNTLYALAGGVSSYAELRHRIKTVFSNEAEGISFSTIHKAKGLEANEVYVLRPELMPSGFAKKRWQRQQESNLAYVAYTRAKNKLILVAGNASGYNEPSERGALESVYNMVEKFSKK